MRLQCGRGAACVCALLLFVGAAPAEDRVAVQGTQRPALQAPRDAFDQLYQRGQRANAAMQTLTARFTETTTSSLLTRPLVSHGRLAVERPSRVVLRYTDPEARVVLIDGNRMTLTWPSRKLRQETDIGSAQGRVQKYFVNGTAADLRKQFDIDAHDTSDRPNTHYVTLVPRQKQIREGLARLDVWVNKSSLLMDAMKMTFANGETKMMTFEDVVPNATIESGTFSVDR